MIEPRPWLSLVGIGEDGVEGLSPAARNRIARATLVVGGARHLALAAPISEAATLCWPSPIEDAIPALLARRGEPTCVLASGDPFCFGVGTLLRRHFAAEDILCLPAPSAFSLAAARLGWSSEDCAMLSLHGRALEAIIPHLQPSAKILALSWDGATPGKLAQLLVERGMGRSILTVCEAMGGASERQRSCVADGFAMPDVAALNTIALEVVAERGARVLPRAALPDEYFEHDGQITKRETRALTLSALAPRRGEMLWDIGAGSGSIAIEWMLADPANRAIAIEQDPERAARIARNALALGVPALRVVEGRAPAALEGLPQPRAIFVGGGASAPGALESYLATLAPGGRLVVNAVTLETQAELSAAYKRWGGDLVQASFAHAEPVGRYNGWRAAMPLVQWRIEKPWPD